MASYIQDLFSQMRIVGLLELLIEELFEFGRILNSQRV